MRGPLLRAAALASLVASVLPSGDAIEFSGLKYCSATSKDLSLATGPVTPCILYDEGPKVGDSVAAQVFTLVQVTPSGCRDHRDGALTSVRMINSQNKGRGGVIGYYGDTYMKVRFISVIGGNPSINNTLYSQNHASIIASMLNETASGIRADFVVGTCSFASLFEREAIENAKKIVLAQVGPPSYYDSTSKYIFGIHISSDEYTVPTLQGIDFSIKNASVSILSRTASEFFRSTCDAAFVKATGLGLNVVRNIRYNPFADVNGNGIPDEQDPEVLEKLADRICPGDTGASGALSASIIACISTDTEANVLLDRWAKNKCNPAAIWFTSSTWAWGLNNPSKTKFMSGGAQWHEQFKYSDEFFASGVDLLEYQQRFFNYSAVYDAVASYTAVQVFSSLIEFYYRGENNPNITTTLASNYESVRRTLLTFTSDTIFGRVSFDRNKRNVGRQAAGSQFLSAADPSSPDSNGAFVSTCLSPRETAEASFLFPAPNNEACPRGFFRNTSALTQPGVALLSGVCSECPVDTYTFYASYKTSCDVCSNGSSTVGLSGQFQCVFHDDGLIPTGILGVGYAFVSINWLLSIGFAVWVYLQRKDPVVQISQAPFLWLLCFGAMTSSSAIIPLSMQVGNGEHSSMVNAACVAIPWLYCIGFTLQFSSLCAKTLRLYRCVNNPKLERVKVTVYDVGKIVVLFLSFDFTVLLVWTLVNPLVWERTQISASLSESTHVLTVQSVGMCMSDNSWAYVGSLIVLHLALLVVTNFFLYQVRRLNNRYQESKYIAFCCISALELLLLGIPILVAVGNNPTARYLVLAGIIFLNDCGFLCFTFLPKIYFQRKGLGGQDVVESIHPARATQENHTAPLRRESSTLMLYQSVTEVSRKVESLMQENKVLRAQLVQYQPDVAETTNNVNVASRSSSGSRISATNLLRYPSILSRHSTSNLSRPPSNLSNTVAEVEDDNTDVQIETSLDRNACFDTSVEKKVRFEESLPTDLDIPAQVPVESVRAVETSSVVLT